MSSVQGSTEGAGAKRDEAVGREFPCSACGAEIHFDIGKQSLACPYCGQVQELEKSDGKVSEQDLSAALTKIALRRKQAGGASARVAERETTCQSCAATVVFAANRTVTDCPFCGTSIQLQNIHESKERIPVDGMLPFLVPEARAKESLAAWVRSRWFAPNEFKRRGVDGKFNGLFLPYWTFDAMTFTKYTGERGDAYYVTQGSGKNARRVRRVRWSPASGSFQRFFDDVLVVAAKTLVGGKFVRELEPWPLEKVQPFEPKLMAGLSAMTYDTELDEGFKQGKGRIEWELRQDAKSRIGGDEQKVHTLDVAYSALTYKHLLLPVWLLAYRFHDKTYQVVVNACTGEVQGERPYSKLKIALAVIAAAIAALVLINLPE